MKRGEYIHNQVAPSSTWTVVHGLNSNGVVTDIVVDLNGVLRTAFPFQLTALDDNTLGVTFTSPITGRCRVVGPLST